MQFMQTCNNIFVFNNISDFNLFRGHFLYLIMNKSFAFWIYFNIIQYPSQYPSHCCGLWANIPLIVSRCEPISLVHDVQWARNLWAKLSLAHSCSLLLTLAYSVNVTLAHSSSLSGSLCHCHSGSLWLTLPLFGSLRLTLALSLALPGAHWLTMCLPSSHNMSLHHHMLE